MPNGRPAGGYNFRGKNTYRRKLWDFVDAQLGDSRRERRRRVVAVLETQEGLEVRELLRRGYTPENIYAINANAAILAHLTRNLDADGLPAVQTQGMARDYLAAIESIDRAIDAVNFDACAALGWGDAKSATDPREFWGGYLHRVACRVRPGGVVAHTFLVGRERGEMNGALKEYQGFMVEDHGKRVPATYLHRLQLALAFVSSTYRNRCNLHVTDLAYDWYASSAGHQRMLWFAARVQPHAALPLTPQQWIARVRRQYPARADRMLALMLPWCRRLDFYEPRATEEDLLLSKGKARVRGSVTTSTDGVDDVASGDTFTPWATSVNAPMRV
jgi:hypothetical protein